MGAQDGFILRQGDTKVDSDDLGKVVELLEESHYIIGNNLEVLSEQEKTVFFQGLDFYRSFIEKYVKASDLRRREHLWFALVKVIDCGNFKKVTREEIKNAEKLDFYMSFIKELVAKEQEVSEKMKMVIGMAVAIYGRQEVKRYAWGEYLEAKTNRENNAANSIKAE